MSRFNPMAWMLLLAGLANEPPTASFTVGPSQGPPPLTVSADGSGSSDGDGSVIAWAWDWGDGSGSAAGTPATHVYGATGTYVVTLSVTDDQGATSSTTREITCISAGNLAPVAVIQSAVPSVGHPPAQVMFFGAGHDDTGPLEHRWEFGDGSPALILSNVANHSITTPSHTFADPGTYEVRLRVTDPENVASTHRTSFLVTVRPPDDGGGGGCGATGLEAFLVLGWLRRPARRRPCAGGRRNCRP